MKTILPLLFLLAFQSAQQPALSAGTESCKEAGGLVKVKVRGEESASSPRVFRYSVMNSHTSPVFLFLLGTGAGGSAMEILPQNLPEEILAPPGWKGLKIFEEESEFMHLLWEASGDLPGIMPNGRLDGFAVRMPEKRQPARLLYDSHGRPVQPLDMTAAPFTVFFRDGSCAWGRVEIEKD